MTFLKKYNIIYIYYFEREVNSMLNFYEVSYCVNSDWTVFRSTLIIAATSKEKVLSILQEKYSNLSISKIIIEDFIPKEGFCFKQYFGGIL